MWSWDISDKMFPLEMERYSWKCALLHLNLKYFVYKSGHSLFRRDEFRMKKSSTDDWHEPKNGEVTIHENTIGSFV